METFDETLNLALLSSAGMMTDIFLKHPIPYNRFVTSNATPKTIQPINFHSEFKLMFHN